MASTIVHGLVLASLWSESPQYMANAQYAEVMVEILSAEPEQPLSTHPVKIAVAPVNLRSHPVEFSTVKTHTPGFSPIRASTPKFTSSIVANTQTVKTPRPVQTTALASPAASRQAQGVDQKDSRNTVRKHLEAFKYYPASARRRGIEGDVDVSFMLVRGGVAEQVEVLKGSGYAVLDRAAMTTVARAQPFPVGNGQYRFHLRFRKL